MPPTTTETLLKPSNEELYFNSSMTKTTVMTCQTPSVDNKNEPTTANQILTHRSQISNQLNNNNNNISISNLNNLNNNNNNLNNNQHHESETINEHNYLAAEKLNVSPEDIENAKDFQPQIRWPDLLVQIFLHTGCLYGLYLLFYVKLQTLAFFCILIVATGFGITAGAHRLWSHKSYKAKLPLRLILVFLFTIAGQRDAYTWALDHRIHHKFSETDADPHNAKRGFFFAHVGWLFLTPHPLVIEKRRVIDMSDLEQDQVVVWQRRLYIPLFAIFVIGLPAGIPWYFWNENLWLSFWTCFCCRFCIVLNIAFFVNSVAHMYGNRPYDKKISPTESLPVAIAALGEGWHNYHHVFPWDYKTGEFGANKFNPSTKFIDFFARFGWAYDRKSVSSDMVARRAAKCGDGTHYLNDESAHKDSVWGYGDKDIPKEDAIELEAMHD